jgi:hypothetical protein
VIVAAKIGGSYEERTCLRRFEGRVYDMQRGAWVACQRCSGSGRVVVYLYPKLGRRPRSAARNRRRTGVLVMGLWSFVLRGRGGSWKLAVALLSVHTSSKNPPPISGMQAYIAYLLGR